MFSYDNKILQRKVPISKTVLQLEKRILEAHTNVQNLPLMEAKMAFIKAWQSLPDYGISYFIVKQKNAKKEVKYSFYISEFSALFNRLLKFFRWFFIEWIDD